MVLLQFWQYFENLSKRIFKTKKQLFCRLLANIAYVLNFDAIFSMV